MRTSLTRSPRAPCASSRGPTCCSRSRRWRSAAVKTGAREFSVGLFDLIYGKGSERAKFETWCEVVASLPRKQTRVLTWPLVTVFGFVAVPDRHIFLKPNVTRIAAREYEFDFDYRSKPNWDTYTSLLEFAEAVRRDTRDLKPKDMQRRIRGVGPRPQASGPRRTALVYVLPPRAQGPGPGPYSNSVSTYALGSNGMRSSALSPTPMNFTGMLNCRMIDRITPPFAVPSSFVTTMPVIFAASRNAAA